MKNVVIVMAELYFRYGQMNASKSIQLLTVAHNYEEQGKTITAFIPAVVNGDEPGSIRSRVGIQRPAKKVGQHTNILEEVMQDVPDCVLVDEAQFLTREHVEQLARVVDELGIEVIAYGLLKDFRNQLFEGSEALVLFADQIEEIKTICAHPECSKKATMIQKVRNGRPVYEGEQVEIGGNELYRSVCRRHYLNWM